MSAVQLAHLIPSNEIKKNSKNNKNEKKEQKTKRRKKPTTHTTHMYNMYVRVNVSAQREYAILFLTVYCLNIPYYRLNWLFTLLLYDAMGTKELSVDIYMCAPCIRFCQYILYIYIRFMR